MIKNLMQRPLNALGYEVRKLNAKRAPRLELELYKQLYPEDSLANRRFYNVGAGGFSHPYWTNIDHQSDWYAFYKEQMLKGIDHDLFSLKPLPIANSSAEVVYTSHTVEHITNEAAQHLFNETHRILKPNGYFRLTTPNIELEYRAFSENDRHYYRSIDRYSIEANWKKAMYNGPLNKASTAQIFLFHFASSVSMLHADGAPERITDDELLSLFKDLGFEGALDHCISRCPVEIQKKYPGNHLNWWSYAKMTRMLKQAGFSRIHLSGYQQSYCPVLRNTDLFDNTHPRISLYVEAIK